VTSKDKIIAEGYTDFWSGVLEEDNPYDEFLMAPQHELWLEGYYGGVEEITGGR